MNVCLIPCYQRPEFLHWVLKFIGRNDEADDILFLFCVDYGYDSRVLKLIKDFPYEKKIVKRKSKNFGDKLSYNILDGYKRATELTDDLVYMIESDVFVSNDFFNWHNLVHADKDIFCSIAVKNVNSNYSTGNSLEKYYTTDNDYMSCGVAFKQEVLKEFILPHVNKKMFKHTYGYVMKYFGDSRFGDKWLQQAGLIRRIQELKTDLPIAYPHVPRAYHAGFYGSNRPPTHGNLRYDVKKERVKKIATNRRMMERASLKKSWYEDSKPQKLDLDKTEKVEFDGHYS